MKLKSPLFWVYLVVIIYLVSMLVYVSVEFFGGADTNKISAFGSILGGVGTIFAGFIAIYLFNDWRVQENAVFKRNLAHRIYDDMGQLFIMMLTSQHVKYDIDTLQSQFHKIILNLLLYNKKDKKIEDLILNFGIIYTRQIGVLETYKKNNQTFRTQDNMKFLSEYNVILQTFAELVVLDLSDDNINLFLTIMNNALSVDASEQLVETRDEILKKAQ